MRLQTAKTSVAKTHQKEMTDQIHSPLPIRIREHVCSDGDLNLEKALRITRAATFEVPMNLVFQVRAT